MTAKIIPFPGVRFDLTDKGRRSIGVDRSCYDCEHAAVGSQTFCTLFREFILDERSAVECGEFLP